MNVFCRPRLAPIPPTTLVTDAANSMATIEKTLLVVYPRPPFNSELMPRKPRLLYGLIYIVSLVTVPIRTRSMKLNDFGSLWSKWLTTSFDGSF